MDADGGPFDWIEAGPPYEGPPLTPVGEQAEKRLATNAPIVSDRYAALHLEDESVIVYDCRETNAWIQSSHAVSLGAASESAETGRRPDARTSDSGEQGR